MINHEQNRADATQFYQEARAFDDLVDGLGEDVVTCRAILMDFVGDACERNINEGKIVKVQSGSHYIDWSEGRGEDVERYYSRLIVGKATGYGCVRVRETTSPELGRPVLAIVTHTLFDRPAYCPRPGSVVTPILSADIQVI